VCNVSFLVCVVLCAVLSERGVILCVLCLIVVPLPPGKTSFAVQLNNNKKLKTLVRERTIPTERPPLVGEVTTNFCG
jgi:hypothetical protein